MFHEFRCLSRTVTEISEDPSRAYRIDLELSPIIVPDLCTPPDTHQFHGVDPLDGFLFEIANVEDTPADSGSRDEQAPTSTQDTVDLSGAGLLMAGFVWDAELSSEAVQGFPTSADLTYDYRFGDNLSPQYFIGHALVGSGTNSGNISYAPRPNDYGGWASSAAVFTALSGTPTIVQSVHTGSTGDTLNIGLPSPAQPGSVLVIFLTERNRNSPFVQPTIFPVTSGWVGLDEVKTPTVSGPVSRQLRMMWYQCSDE